MIRGTFHFHSTYSHDGRTSLAETAAKLRSDGFSFVIMTEHFEDFDRGKFDAYIREVDALNRTGGLVLIPGMEVNFEGIDTIKFPVREYDDCMQFAAQAQKSGENVLNVIAHPSKYPFHKVAAHLEKYDINGIELWNQQADGSYAPPLQFLKELQVHKKVRSYQYFFGCDLHDVNLRVTNFLVVPKP